MFALSIASRRISIVLLLIAFLTTTAKTASVNGKVEFMDGDVAIGVSIIGMAFSSPFPISTVTDSSGQYSLSFSFLPGMSDTVFIICSAPDSFNPSPEYHKVYLSAEDTLHNLDFELRPADLPILHLAVWTHDSLGNTIRGVQISVQLDETGSSVFIDSTDFGGRVVFTLIREGNYIVTASRDEFFSIPEVETVFVSAELPAPTVRFVMYPEVFVSPYWFYIFSVDSLDNPVESLFVEWELEDEPGRYPLWTNEDGCASVNPPSEGVYLMRAVYTNPGLIVVPNWAYVELTPEMPIDTVIFRILPDTTSISEHELPNKCSISVHPNPFNSRARIIIEAEQRPVSAMIYDISGREIEEIFFDYGQSRYVIDWKPPSDTYSGLYIISVRLLEQTLQAKMLFLK